MGVTVRDIAARAGVSIATVSRALNNSPKVHEETRKMVQRLAKKMKYRPDPVLAGLAAYRSSKRPHHRYEKLAVLVYEKWYNTRTLFFNETIQGIQTRCRELGFQVDVAPIAKGRAPQLRLSRRLFNQGTRGIILLPMHIPLTGIEWNRFSIVGFGEAYKRKNLHYISTDQDDILTECYRHLRHLGYRHIGYANSRESEERTDYLFYAAYLKCRALDGLPPAPPLFNETENWSGVQEWLKRNDFDAIFCTNADLLFFLRKWGIQIPSDLGFVGLSTQTNAKMYSSALYVFDYRKLGGYAVDFMQLLIQHNQYGIPKRDEQRAIYLRGRWQNGPTVRKMKETSALDEA